MRIAILCSDQAHPVYAYLERWKVDAQVSHDINLVNRVQELQSGDMLFLVSCAEIVTQEVRAKFGVTLVLHASDLPRGRGWSPHIWELSKGAQHITLSLLEAEDKVDSGRIWRKLQIPVPANALWDEINELLFSAELELIDYAVANAARVEPQEQPLGGDTPHYPRRTPNDSRIDPARSIAEQFDLIRTCDPNRFPAFFDHLGCRYILKVEKANEQ